MSGHSTGTGHDATEGGRTAPRDPAGGATGGPHAQTDGAADGTGGGGGTGAPGGGPFLRAEDQREFERIVEQAGEAAAAARTAAGTLADCDGPMGARADGEAERPGFSPGRAWAGATASAAAVLVAQTAAGVPQGTAAPVALLVLAAATGTAYLASPGGRRHGPDRAAGAGRRAEADGRERRAAVERTSRRTADEKRGGPPAPEPSGDPRPDQAPEPAAVFPRLRRTGREPVPSPVAQSALSRSFSQLPLHEGPFVGRDHALSLISQWARAAGERGGVPCVVVLHGSPGSGRTALAVRAAEMMRERYRGTCLVNLRGRSPAARPSDDEQPAALSTREALLHLLNRLGAPRQDLLFRDPPSPGVHLRRLRQRYREHLAGLPAVLILDDASDARQVRELVPEQSGSLVLVTSREPMDLGGGIVSHDLPVGPLPPREAEALLTALSGPGSGPEARKAAVRASGGLPLAVRMAGAALARPPGGRPDAALPAGTGPAPAAEPGPAPAGKPGAGLPADGRPSPEGVIGLGYEALDPQARQLFRRLVLVGRASLGTAAAAALLGSDEAQAAVLLEALAGAHMAEHVHSGRYRLPDMLRSFARRRLEDEEDARERAAAQERLINDYAELAASVIHRVEGVSSSRAVRAPVRGFDSLDAALSWLDEESSFITAALRQSGDVRPSAVQALVEALCDYCLLRGDLYRLGGLAELAQTLGRDPLIRAVALRTGIAARQLGQLDRARATLSSVVSLYREGGNEADAARALCSLGITLHHRGSLAEAEAELREAAALQGPDERRADRAWTLHALGAVRRDRGGLAEAWELLHTALALHEEAESLHGQAWTCLQLGQVHLRVGQVEEAEERLRLSRELYRRTRDGRGEAWALTQLGRAALLRGGAGRAVRELDEARSRHRAHEDARGEAWTLYYLGQALEDAGRLDRAEDALSRARHMFSTMGDRYGHACARHHFGRVTRDRLAGRSGSLKNSGFARQLLHEARQDFRTVGLPHGEAWSCVELAVIDAGCGRTARAAELLGDARALFADLGDGRGESWAVFLHSTLPPASDDGRHEAGRALERLLEEPDERCHPLVRRHSRTWLDGPWTETKPGSPWPVWQLGLAPARTARDVMGVSVHHGPGRTGPPADGLSGN